MKAFLAILLMVGVVYGARIHDEREHEHGGEWLRGKTEEHKAEEKKIVEELEEKKKVLGAGDSFIEGVLEYFMKDPLTKMDRECYDKLKTGQSIDFIIDLAPSPSRDEVDRWMSEKSPFSKLIEKGRRTPSRAYFDAVQTFIDGVTIGMKPERTCSVINEEGRKYFIKGRSGSDVETLQKLKSSGEFTDMTRNLKTFWPVATKESLSYLGSIAENNLGRLTKLTLWNRDNGLPVVLSATRRSKPVYNIVISDGSSRSKITDLVDDVSKTTVIDIGNRRFLNTIPKDLYSKLISVYTLTSPQRLPMLIDTIRFVACRQGEQASA